MLVIKDLEQSFGDARILNSVNFAVADGEQVGIIGPNGCGKTTLFNCICGFVTPNKGEILLNDINLVSLPPHKRAALGVGRVFQHFGIFREMTVLENVLVALEGRSGASILPWSSRTRSLKEEAREVIDKIRLSDKISVKAGTLSGGQMRLLEIARTIAFGAKLLLLDEPTAGVSPKMKGEIQTALKTLRDLGKTVLVIEHDIDFIETACKRILVLDEGRVVLDGTPTEVRSDPRLQEVYFGAATSN